MKRIALLALVLLVAIVPVAMVNAQEPPEPGEGGVIFTGTTGLANIGSFNPMRCSGTDCQDIFTKLFPTLVGIDAETADFTPGADGSLATGWEFNEDGTVLTVFLREDYFWTDGEQVTAEDVKFTYEAIASGVIESDLTGYIDTIITDVTIVDDFTVELTFAEADCTSFNVASYYVVPAHAYGFEGDFESFDYTALVNHPMDTEPAITGSVFAYDSTVTGQQINLVGNQSYADAPDGVTPTGYAIVDVPDFAVEVERFLAGDVLNFIEVGDVTQMQTIRDSGNPYFDFPSNSYTYFGFNLANPENPQNGVDEEGNLVEQDPHPIFGDVRVRQALAHAVDVQTIVDEVLEGEGLPIFGTEIPTSWAVHPELQPYAYDVAMAESLLEEAGWTDADGDGVRECNGCLYSEEGTPFEFDLITNQGNPVREAIGTLLQDQFGELGITVNFTPLDFNTVVDTILNQTHDAVIIGWSLSFPSNPDQTQIFGAEADAVGSGFNFGSWVNADYIALNEEARTVAGCDPAARAEIYYDMQEIAYEELPYIFLYSPNNMYAVNGIEGFSPYPNQPFWNVETWYSVAE